MQSVVKIFPKLYRTLFLMTWAFSAMAKKWLSPENWSKVCFVESSFDVGQFDGDQVESVRVKLFLDLHQLEQ